MGEGEKEQECGEVRESRNVRDIYRDRERAGM